MVAAGDEILDTDITDLEDLTIRKPIGRMVQAVAQSIPDNTITAVTWTTEDIDTDNFHDTATNNTRITPTVAGYYRFDFLYYSASQTTGVSTDASFRKNGSGSIASGQRGNLSSLAWAQDASTIVEMNGSTDYIECMALQDSSGAVNTNVSGRFTSVCMWEFIRSL